MKRTCDVIIVVILGHLFEVCASVFFIEKWNLVKPQSNTTKDSGVVYGIIFRTRHWKYLRF